MIKIPIHSTTDLITNSSTVIFTYSENSEGALVEMINEMFNTFGIDKTCDDVFDTVVLTDKDEYEEHAEEYAPVKIDDDELDQLYDDVLNCRINKPDWFKEVEGHENSWTYYTPETYLHLVPKKEEYKKLAELVRNFLYSADHEASHDG